jgi:hypothetical protein
VRFPDPVRPATLPCARCRRATRVDRLVHGFGEDCAAKLGLIATTPRLHVHAQTGPDLLNLLNGDDDGEPDDTCDGWDR